MPQETEAPEYEKWPPSPKDALEEIGEFRTLINTLIQQHGAPTFGPFLNSLNAIQATLEKADGVETAARRVVDAANAPPMQEDPRTGERVACFGWDPIYLLEEALD